MASQKNFAITPSVSISRSKFRRPSQHKTTFNLGELVPIYVDEILPGDTVSMDLAALVRMQTPYAPIMDNIFVDYYAFFVPNRIVWKDWKQFMGENTTSYGAATEPAFAISKITSSKPVTVGSLGDHLGLPIYNGANGDIEVSSLPGRSYYTIYNEWFRDQNLIAPYAVRLGSGNGECAIDPVNNSYLYYNGDLLKVAKESDYFTRSLPYAQKSGSPVKLPLGTRAPVVHDGTFDIQANVSGSGLSVQLDDLVPGTTTTSTLKDQGGNTVVLGSAYADLSNATAATINQLRFAFQYQKFLEKDALYGTRYWEILKGHFGITAPDASLQRPELLGHFRQHININQVLQTSESSNTPLGTPGANSVSGKSDHLVSKSFVEHGTLMILCCARHEQTYAQSLNRMWSRKHRTDFYFPVFANLGAQEVLSKEIYCDGSSSDDLPFGFQEAWAEYRYKPSIVSGLMRPGVSGSLAVWNLANNFGSRPTLGKTFIEQDRNALAGRCLTISTGPDFFADFYFDAIYVRPMPTYSIPGLIDHH